MDMAVVNITIVVNCASFLYLQFFIFTITVNYVFYQQSCINVNEPGSDVIVAATYCCLDWIGGELWLG